MPLRNPASPDHDVDDFIRERWSPRHFADRPVRPGALRRILEAARWAPSSYNEQPWAFVLARREEEDAFETLLNCLVEGNRSWAHRAPVLMATFAKRTFDRNGRENLHAWHDVGLAMSQLVLQATEIGLLVHQMAGIRRDALRETYRVPGGWDPVTAAALGWAPLREELDVEARRKEMKDRSRKPLEAFVFGACWGRSSEVLDSSSA